MDAATPSAMQGSILTINGGSSSIKFALFSNEQTPKRFLNGQVERIGTPDAQLAANWDNGDVSEKQKISGGLFGDCVEGILLFLRQRLTDSTLAAVGHRIVHGGIKLLDHQLITDQVLTELRAVQPLDLDHLPNEIALIESFRKTFSTAPQFACFDTAFHRDLPHIAQLLPIPRRYFERGVRKFGFHGLSYTYLMAQLAKIAGDSTANGKVILAHLGSGSSIAAVRGGKPVDTTMSFTPAAGLVMGTRPGDMDPGLVTYLMKDLNLLPTDADHFIAQQCGMLGISETSSDMRALLAARATDPRAADAVDLFCYQAKKQLCGLAATLGGLGTLVFSGGIGEHAPEVRTAICDDLAFLGIEIDAASNLCGASVISAENSRVTVRIIATDEEAVIAGIAHNFLLSPLPR